MKKIKHNAEVLVLVVGIVLIWRGIWGFADTFLFPETPILSFVISLVAGIMLLYFHNPKNKTIDEAL